MEINIGISNIDESNDFLKSLWAEMEKEFGKCGWYYTPVKQNNRIFFGYMRIGDMGELSVSISYKQKGTINNLYFELGKDRNEIPKKSELWNRLKNVVRLAKSNQGDFNYFRCSIPIESYYPIASYETEFFKTEIISKESTHLSFLTKAYDEKQVKGTSSKKIKQIMDFLSLETNGVYWRGESSTVDQEKTILKNEIYQDDEFIDGMPIKEECIVLSKEGKEFLNQIINPDIQDSKDIEIFLKACHHFHSARKYDEQEFSNALLIDGDSYPDEIEKRKNNLKIASKMGESHVELATTLYMSALEVVTLIGAEKEICSACGQPKYQIARRVRDLVKEHLGEHLASDLNYYYNLRSKYLHTGLLIEDEEFGGYVVPQLDVNSKSGCKDVIGVPLINLREYVGYCLREYYKKNLLIKS
ncbi:hypothetical protein XJ18_06785 [Bacillus pumilus]|uniref:hypothetical protein n=1 Tax=Bacillus TaxID=1386 RepID=UPI0006402334|nr:hypothetical protein [Bacillus altitudinis]KLL00090.1 hypothetical protein XJ18_06785 [Bacillus pumilus]WQH37800.1 hypothetical protein U2873_13295 [Bacillus altitudinis]